MLKAYDVVPLSGYPVEYAVLLAALQDGTREWREELGDVEPRLIAWQPYPQGYSIGGVLLHIAEVEAHWIEVFCLDRELEASETKLYRSHEIDQYAGKWPTCGPEPLGYYYDLLDKVRGRTLESVKAFSNPETVKASRWGRLSLRWVLAHVTQHDSYHGGQAVLLHEMAKRLAG
jgi:uncharacterized damage-inducible protein DinB